jgi:hypothetical protein
MKRLLYLLLGILIGISATYLFMVADRQRFNNTNKLLDMAFVIDKEAVEHNLMVLYGKDYLKFQGEDHEFHRGFHQGASSMYWKIFCGQADEKNLTLPSPLDRQARRLRRNQEIFELANTLSSGRK